jgi:hypothetical protein
VEVKDVLAALHHAAAQRVHYSIYYGKNQFVEADFHLTQAGIGGVGLGVRLLGSGCGVLL